MTNLEVELQNKEVFKTVLREKDLLLEKNEGRLKDLERLVNSSKSEKETLKKDLVDLKSQLSEKLHEIKVASLLYTFLIDSKSKFYGRMRKRGLN
jgi:hypothetical protein